MSFTPVSVFLSLPLIILSVYTHSLVTVSTFIPLFFAVILRVTLIVIHVIPISVTLTATVPISSQLHGCVLLKTRNRRL